MSERVLTGGAGFTDGPVLVIGGAGFIGSNLAAHLAAAGRRVRVYDNLSRPGVARNLAWLRREHGAQLETVVGDVREPAHLRDAIAGASAVFHFAAQVGVTASLVDPRLDLDVNARGTLEVLEAVRAQRKPPPLVYASTSKVYGSLPGITLRQAGDRWVPTDDATAASGIDEGRPLAFATPHGCAKGAADQYVLDYAHTFGLPTTVFRLSCIYGPHQLGAEDQGWVAHFLIRAIDGEPITVYGDGRQVRDLLYVDDLVDALVRAGTQIDAVRGRAFNLGGGPEAALSLRELLAQIEALRGDRLAVRYDAWRAGDQRWYVSDTSAFRGATGWRPQVAPQAGVELLHDWLSTERVIGPREAAHA
jgi:CDP-paratose 2-epimerase